MMTKCSSCGFEYESETGHICGGTGTRGGYSTSETFIYGGANGTYNVPYQIGTGTYRIVQPSIEWTRERGFEKISREQWDKDYAPHSNPNVRTFLTYDEVQLPKRATSHSAGYDVFSPVGFVLKPNESINIPTCFKAYMREDEKLVFHPRSGLGFKYFIRLANTTGVGDSDYYNNEGNEGHYWVKIRNEGDKEVVIECGDAIAQCIFEKYLLADGDDFTGEKRVGGFGSTG